MIGKQAYTPVQCANDAVRQVLQTQYEGLAAVRLDSPPGAGKTRVVEYLAVQSLAKMKERCMIATQTNEQAFDVARRCAEHFPHLPFVLFVRRDLPVPGTLNDLMNLQIARDSGDVPNSPCVVIANAARWSWMDRSQAQRFDLLIVDEAFQLPDFLFHQISSMADRIVLVGDPGQIAPVITCKIERWCSELDGPHVPCPEALLARHPEVPRMTLPVSWRLVPDTIRFVQPSFYPELSFTSICQPEDRGLTSEIFGLAPIDRIINRVIDGASLVQVDLPSRITGEVDEELAETIITLIERLIQRRLHLFDQGAEVALEARMIGVVCTHVSQVHAVQERLSGALSDVFVETADRFQGLERPVMIAWHPLSGRADASLFHLDAGRICVMLSRHRIICFLVARSGIEDMLFRYTPSGNRVLGIQKDEEFNGWNAHVSLLDALRREERRFSLA